MVQAAADAVKRLIVPTVTRAAWREAVLAAEEDAVRVFSANLKSLLLTPPLRVILSSETDGRVSASSTSPGQFNMVICGVDPGLKQGHKVYQLCDGVDGNA